MRIYLRPAHTEDIPRIARLAEKIWPVHYTPIIGKEQVKYMLEKMYSEKSLTQQKEEGQQFFLCYADENELGYISISSKNGKDFFLHKFYLDTDQQGRGYGKKYFSELITLYPDLETIRLQVNRMNYKSINFYFKAGFVIEDAKDFDIGDGYFMEDYVMVYKSPSKRN